MSPARTFLFLAIISGFGAGAAAADPKLEAEAMFRQGRDLMNAGKLPEACAAFAASQKLDPAPTTMLNLGFCREKNHQLATAWGTFVEVERQLRPLTDDASKQLAGIATTRIAALEPRLSKLTITVPAGSVLPDLEVRRDGEIVAASAYNFALPIDGGTYKIVAHASGREDWFTSITIKPEADAQDVRIPTLVPIAVAKKPERVPTRPAPAAHSHLPAIALGIGALALAGGAVGVELWGNSTIDKANAAAKDPAMHDQVDSLWHSANKKRYVAEGLGIAALGSAGVAIFLVVRGGSESPSQVAHRGVTIEPLIASDRVGLAIGGSL